MGALAELKDRKRRKSAKAASDADVRPSILPNGESVVYDLCWHCELRTPCHPVPFPAALQPTLQSSLVTYP